MPWVQHLRASALGVWWVSGIERVSYIMLIACFTPNAALSVKLRPLYYYYGDDYYFSCCC